MSGDVTQIRSRIKDEDPHAANQLLSLVYKELRKLASNRVSQEPVGHSLDRNDWNCAVHESRAGGNEWSGRGHC